MKMACKKEHSRTHKNMLKQKNLTIQKFPKITHVMGMSETLTLTGRNKTQTLHKSRELLINWNKMPITSI